MSAVGTGEAADDDQVVFHLTSASKPHVRPAACFGVGSVLAGKYRLDSVLGEGSIGTVWQATNLLLDATVAIKLAHAKLAGPECRARLRLEARLTADVGHPAIIRVFDVGETDLGDPFIVMELLRGATLAQIIAGGNLTAIRAVQLVLPIVDALAAIHARGIVHRDVKPDNLFISFEDRRVQPKLLDFGIALLNGSRGKGGALSESGMLVGSPEYMSPEQAMARDDIDFRTDIWSVCIALYEALSGEAPFVTVSDEALLGAITELEPASLAECGACDEQLWQIVRIGLAKDRFARHASMGELGRALASWLVSHGITEDASGTSLESRWFADVAVRPSVCTPEMRDVDVAQSGICEEERKRAARWTPPSKSSARARTVIHPRSAHRAIKALALAAIMVTTFFAVRSVVEVSAVTPRGAPGNDEVTAMSRTAGAEQAAAAPKGTLPKSLATLP